MLTFFTEAWQEVSVYDYLFNFLVIFSVCHNIVLEGNMIPLIPVIIFVALQTGFSVDCDKKGSSCPDAPSNTRIQSPIKTGIPGLNGG
jgi:hypothetical protein